MCLWHSWLKKNICIAVMKFVHQVIVTKDMHLTSSTSLYMRHPHLCIPSRVYIYPTLATHNNIIVFDIGYIYIYLYINLSYNNTCSTGKYTPSFEVSATKSWTDKKYTSEGEKVLGEFTRQEHIWALCKIYIYQIATHDWFGISLPTLQLFNNFSQTILNLVKRTEKRHEQHKAYFHAADDAGVICS
jgi:hypothetical protein